MSKCFFNFSNSILATDSLIFYDIVGTRVQYIFDTRALHTLTRAAKLYGIPHSYDKCNNNKYNNISKFIFCNNAKWSVNCSGIETEICNANSAEQYYLLYICD